MTQGGKREGAGRPLLPDDERLSATVRIRLTEGQAEALEDLIAAHKCSARAVLLAGVAAFKRRKA